jgi:acyl-CoA thioester hydrolase
MTHEIRMVGTDGASGAVHAEGGAKVVWVNFLAEKSVPLPDKVRALLPQALL